MLTQCQFKLNWKIRREFFKNIGFQLTVNEYFKNIIKLHYLEVNSIILKYVLALKFKVMKQFFLIGNVFHKNKISKACKNKKKYVSNVNITGYPYRCQL